MTDRPLAGKVALVTGAARRTGRAIALRLAQAGADLVVHYRHSEAQAEETAAQCSAAGAGRAWAASADLADPEAPGKFIETVLERAGRLDLLVNNVGNYPLGAPLAQSPADFAETLQTNLVAPFALVRAAADGLRAHRGQVINIGYVGVDNVVANRQAMAYQISKTGLLILTKTLAQELGPAGVRVNMVSPGHLDNSVDLPEAIASHVPLGRAGKPEEVAEAVFFLLCRGDYITGANLEVGGGYRLSLARRLLE